MSPIKGGIAPEILGLPLNPIRGVEPVIAQRRQKGDIVHTLHIGNRSELVDLEAAGALAQAYFRGDLATLPYVQSQGTNEMRDAASRYFQGLYRPDEIVVTAGSSEAMLYYTMISQAPGEANVVFAPGYPNYFTYAQATGRRVASVNRTPEAGFRYPNASELHRKLDLFQEQGESPVSMTIISPDNPTGVVPTEAELLGLLQVARERGMWVFGDLAYNHLTTRGGKTMDQVLREHPEFLENTVLTASVSKEFRGCGARLGWVASKSPQFIRYFTQLAAARGSVNTISQRMFPQAISQDLDVVHDDYELNILPRARAVIDTLHDLTGGAVTVVEPEGGIYCWIDLKGLGVKDAAKFTEFMASTYGESDDTGKSHTVTVAPGSGFYSAQDPDAPKTWARIALTEEPEDLIKDMGLLVRGAQAFSNS
jgi:aspartate aminotransferase